MANNDLNDQEKKKILDHFYGDERFRNHAASWEPGTDLIFCRFAKVVHEAGLDWYYRTGGGTKYLQYGRRSKGGTPRRRVVGGIFLGVTKKYLEVRRGKNDTAISILGVMGEKDDPDREILTDAVVNRIADELSSARKSNPGWPHADRPGWWPDEYSES